MTDISTLTIFQIALEFWGVMVCIAAIFGIIIGKAKIHANKLLKIVMQLWCIILLSNDSLAFYFRGRPGNLAYYMVRISNFTVFFSNYIYMSLFAYFLWKSVANKDENKPRRLYIIYGLSMLGIVLLIISQFNRMFYNFDSQNVYHRGTAYIVTQLIAIIGIAINFTILLQYRKRLEKTIFYAMLSYFILPAIATVIVIIHYGLALQNLALVISTQIMFFVDLLEVSQKLDKSEVAVLEARYAVAHDSLTGLYNKATGMEMIREYIENMYSDGKASLCFIDIDNFKDINDIYGHMEGDYWIKEISEMLVAICRKDDIVCRFGGDEYLLFFKDLADDKILESKINCMNDKLNVKASEIGKAVHCSIGICKIIGNKHTFDDCLKKADEILYDVKKNGKNSFGIQAV